MGGLNKLKILVTQNNLHYLKYGQKPQKTSLKGNGDFRSDECIEILKEADIVCTNPPFSLFQEYIIQLISYNKKFLILGSQNKLTITSVFKQIMNKSLWLGINHGVMLFDSDYENYSSNKKNNLISVSNMCWFTNLDHKRRYEKLILYKKYNSKDYPKYINFDAINVDKVVDIPKDYNAIIGVPISYMHKHNP